MNKYLKNLKRIEFVITSSCTGKCRHCSQGEHTSCDKLDKNIAADALRKISKEYNISSVMTFGGEPLLFPETVFEIHKAATEMNISHRQLITNGYFSNDKSEIKSVAKMLSESGVNDILLSVDAFHQETIPLEHVKVFAEYLLKYKLPVRVHPAWLVSRTDDNPYNNKTWQLLRDFSETGIKISDGNVIFPSGNAIKYFSEYFDLTKTYDNPYREDPTDLKAISFCANGDILDGNIYKQDIIDILSSYAPENSKP